MTLSACIPWVPRTAKCLRWTETKLPKPQKCLRNPRRKLPTLPNCLPTPRNCLPTSRKWVPNPQASLRYPFACPRNPSPRHRNPQPSLPRAAHCPRWTNFWVRWASTVPSSISAHIVRPHAPGFRPLHPSYRGLRPALRRLISGHHRLGATLGPQFRVFDRLSAAFHGHGTVNGNSGSSPPNPSASPPNPRVSPPNPGFSPRGTISSLPKTRTSPPNPRASLPTPGRLLSMIWAYLDKRRRLASDPRVLPSTTDRCPDSGLAPDHRSPRGRGPKDGVCHTAVTASVQKSDAYPHSGLRAPLLPHRPGRVRDIQPPKAAKDL